MVDPKLEHLKRLRDSDEDTAEEAGMRRMIARRCANLPDKAAELHQRLTEHKTRRKARAAEHVRILEGGERGPGR